MGWIMVRKICTLFVLLILVLVLSACSPGTKPQSQSGEDQAEALTLNSNQDAITESQGVGTNAEPERIIIYNAGRPVTFNKGNAEFEALKTFIYRELNEKSENDQVKLAIINGDVSELTKQLAIEFVYSLPVEFKYPDGSTLMIAKFLVGSAGSSYKSNVFITAPANKGLYAGKLFVLQTDSAYEEFLLTETAGVSMYTEKAQYVSDANEINVVWKNDTDKDLTFGNPFTIQKLVGNEWKAIGNQEAVFTSIGYRVASHSEMKHSYNVRLYSDKLEKGTYRIVTDFLNVLSPGNYNGYQLTANFTVE